ncbi:hypothetical protein NKR23_g7603 [Pleurostoma richardsiae]|uniref:Uncharacterized protein n=1 Tax=Pleurostoma richardsiae TaxID=41990 RepID=A0AA38VMF3_9PEZI|nr:hypothetical protein NKR23_g7603 [Pleurostoma richardsiae]
MTSKLYYSPLTNTSTSTGIAPSLISSTRYTTADIELASFDGASTTASLNPARSIADEDGLDAPPYAARTAFVPTVQLQVQTPGKPLLSLPLPPRPAPIPVFSVPEGSNGDNSPPVFVSVRPKRGSGSCFLIAGGGENEAASRPVLSTTTYRFGPGKYPRVRLFSPHSRNAPVPGSDDSATTATGGDEDPVGDAPSWDDFEVLPRGLLTRACLFRTRLGTFEWRYAGRRERKASAPGADSLLVLDKVVRVFRARSGGGASSGRKASEEEAEEVRTPVARLVRGAETRSPGSSGSSAGNGGRLMVDLRLWAGESGDGEGGGEGGGGEEEEDREMGVVMVVTTCLVMLKKEVDRRRAQQIAVMAAAAGGGGS